MYLIRPNADFHNANLGGVDLSNANLSGVNFSNTNLMHADLRGTKHLTPEQVQSANANSWQLAEYEEEFRKELGLK